MSNASEPLVSVVIAFLNEERFLEEAIQSVIKQDYSNWELVVVDDGSTDRSTKIAKEYAGKYPGKIFYTDHAGHANRGLSASRNHGISQTKGQLVAFLDADDVWLAGKLSNQVSIFSRHPEIAMVAEANKYWYTWEHPTQTDMVIPIGAHQTQERVIPVPAVQDRVFEPMQLMFHLYPLGKGAAPCPSGLLIRREAFTRAGGFEESFTKENQLYEDQAFLSKIYLLNKVYVSSACNNLYRQRPESIVKWVKAKGHYHKVRQFYLQWLSNYLNTQGIENEKLSRLLKKAFRPYQYPLYHFITSDVPQRIVRTSQKLLCSINKQVNH